MPTSCGIKCQIVSKTEFGIFPEFPHPDSSQLANRISPDIFDGDKTEIANGDGDEEADVKVPTPTSELESKGGRFSGRETAVSVYIPTTPDTRFWLRYKIEEMPKDCKYYYLKLLMNGREVASWGIPPIKGYDGQITRAFFDPTDEHVYSDTKTGALYKNMGLERRAFYFTEDTGDSIATDGGLIELRVFRSSGRMRRVQEPAIYKCQEAYGIALSSGGLLQDAHLARFYEWMLIDPINKPYTVFRFHYRSWNSLITMALVPEDHDRKLDPVTPSILALYGLSMELQEKIDQKHFNNFVERPYRALKKRHRATLTAKALDNVPIHDLLRFRIRLRATAVNALDEGEQLSDVCTDGSEDSDVEVEFEAKIRKFVPTDANNRDAIQICDEDKEVSQTPRYSGKLMVDSSSSSGSESESTPEDMGAPKQYNAQDQKYESKAESMDTSGKLEGTNDRSGVPSNLGKENPSRKQSTPKYVQARDEPFELETQWDSSYEDSTCSEPSTPVKEDKFPPELWGFGKESPGYAKETLQCDVPLRTTSRRPQFTDYTSNNDSTLDSGGSPSAISARAKENTQLTEIRQLQGKDHNRGEEARPESTSERQQAERAYRPPTPFNHESESDVSSRINSDLAIPLSKSHALAKTKNFFGISTAHNHEFDSDSSSDNSSIHSHQAISLSKSHALTKAKKFFGVGKSEKARDKEKEILVPYELDEVAPKKSPMLPFRPQTDHFSETPPNKSLARSPTPVGGILANTPPSLHKSREEIAVAETIHPDIFSWLEYQTNSVTTEDEFREIEPIHPRPLPSVAKGLRSAHPAARPLPVIPVHGTSIIRSPDAGLFRSVSARPTVSGVASRTSNLSHNSAVVNGGLSRLGEEDLAHRVRNRSGSLASSYTGSVHTAADGMTCDDASTKFLLEGSSTLNFTEMLGATASATSSDASRVLVGRALPTTPKTRAVRALPTLPITPTAPLNIIHPRDIPIPSIERSPSPPITHTSKFDDDSPGKNVTSPSSSNPFSAIKPVPNSSTKNPVPNFSAQNPTLRPKRSLSTQSSSVVVSAGGSPSKKPERQRGFRGSLDIFTRKLKGLRKDGGEALWFAGTKE